MSNRIYDEITGRVMAFMRSDSDLLLEIIHVGGGKTVNTLKTLEEQGYQWIYLAPFHTVIDENLKFSTFQTYNYLHLKSRAKVCEVDAYKEIAQNNIDIRPICENSCMFKDTTCPYYETKRQLYSHPRSWAGVHHHLKEFLKGFFNQYVDGHRLSSYYEVLIIDENPINMLFENQVANAESLGHLRGVLLNLNITHPHLDRVVALLDHFILNFPGNTPPDYPEILRRITSIEWPEFYDEYQQKLVEELRFERMRIEYIPNEYIRMFITMAEQITEEKIPYMIIKKHASAYTQKKYHFLYFDNSSLLNCPVKIIGLDGTANVPLWESITNRTASTLTRKYIYKNILQLRGSSNPSKNTTHYARYPLSSWVRKGEITSTGLKLCSLIDIICQRKEHNVLIICTKALRPHIHSNIKSRNVIYGNYYYLRSRNDFYELADTVILASEPNVQQFQLECFSELSGWDQSVWRQVFTQEEMIQAVGRIRENLDTTERKRVRDPREIYIFPHTPPTNELNDVRPLYPESTIVTYSDILYGKHDLKIEITDYIKEKGSVFMKDVQREFNLNRSFSKSIIEELEKEGEIIDEGKKGYFISN